MRERGRGTRLYQLLLYLFQKARSHLQPLKKHFLSSFPSTSLTAVASGKRNFSLTLISYRTFRKETKKQNKQTSKKDENCARNQTRFTMLEHSSMNKNNLAAWRHNHPPHKPRRKGKSKINDHCWSLCRMLFWISYNILSIALSSTTILSLPLTANSFLDIIFFNLLCICYALALKSQ